MWTLSMHQHWPVLTRHVSPVWQGFAFPLQQGYLLDGASLTDDTLVFSGGQGTGCKKNFSSLQYYQRIAANKALLIRR